MEGVRGGPRGWQGSGRQCARQEGPAARRAGTQTRGRVLPGACPARGAAADGGAAAPPTPLTDADGDGGAAAADGAHKKAIVEHSRQLRA